MAFARDAPAAAFGDDSPLISVASGRPQHAWTPTLPSRAQSEELLHDDRDDPWFCKSCGAADSGHWQSDAWMCQKCGCSDFTRTPPSRHPTPNHPDEAQCATDASTTSHPGLRASGFQKPFGQVLQPGHQGRSAHLPGPVHLGPFAECVPPFVQSAPQECHRSSVLPGSASLQPWGHLAPPGYYPGFPLPGLYGLYGGCPPVQQGQHGMPWAPPQQPGQAQGFPGPGDFDDFDLPKMSMWM